VRGWVSDNEVLVLSGTGQHSSMKTWAFAVPLSGQIVALQAPRLSVRARPGHLRPTTRGAA